MAKTLFFSDERVAWHIVENDSVAEAVLADLRSRTDESLSVAHDVEIEDGIVIDFGGAVRVPATWVDIPETSVAFLPQHASILKSKIARAELKGERAGGYYKLATAHHQVCLTTATFRKLQAFFVEQWEHIQGLQAKEVEGWAEAIAMVKRHPNIG